MRLKNTLVLLSFLAGLLSAATSQTKINKYGVIVTSQVEEYRRSMMKDSSKQLVNIKKYCPSVIIDFRYASANNFMHKKIYAKQAGAFVTRTTAKAIASVQQQLKQTGLALKIYDAYRPYSATVAMWEPIKNEDYVANPSKGSGHNRGIAVDVTLVDSLGKDINMGTGFDNFTDSAHHNFTALPDSVLFYRKLLKNTMEKNGFIALPTEWWHYSLPNPLNYELLDLSFKALKKID